MVFTWCRFSLEVSRGKRTLVKGASQSMSGHRGIFKRKGTEGVAERDGRSFAATLMRVLPVELGEQYRQRTGPGARMTNDECRRLIISEQGLPQTYFLLSFVDDAGTFLGATCVRAGGVASAIHRTHVLRINPGGLVRTTKMDAAPADLLDRLETSPYRARDLVRAYVASRAS